MMTNKLFDILILFLFLIPFDKCINSLEIEKYSITQGKIQFSLKVDSSRTLLYNYFSEDKYNYRFLDSVYQEVSIIRPNTYFVMDSVLYINLTNTENKISFTFDNGTIGFLYGNPAFEIGRTFNFEIIDSVIVEFINEIYFIFPSSQRLILPKYMDD